jgi:DNA-binding SARP family transcriptional activator/tetratricopeptide (TPR) repeat protein
MIRLSTIGQVSVHIGDKPVPATNELIIATVLYLVAERGKPIPRRTLAEMFFPNADPDTAAHSGRQLVYRLRKLGVPVEGDPATIVLKGDPQWDVDLLLTRDAATDAELEALRHGYLAHFGADYSASFSRWLDEHRSNVTRKLRDFLIRQIQFARSQRDFRKAGVLANACLGLDPLNEEATLASAESLAVAGSKTAAIHLLEKYLDEVGCRSPELRIAPSLLRERISTYLIESDRESVFVGRTRELAALTTCLEQSATGSARACFIAGPGGIGKTRLLDEACAIAAISGHVIARASLSEHDVNRPFAILRELGPALLDLPGAIGAAPATLAAVRGLSGRGPSTFQRRPTDPLESQSVAAQIRKVVTELIEAIADEQPIVLRVECAATIDSASLELLAEVLDGGRKVGLLMAARHEIALPSRLESNPTITRLAISPLGLGDASVLVSYLFAQAGQTFDSTFAENAVRISAGVPLFLHLLFKNYLVTGDPLALPGTLSESLTARLDQLYEPAKSVFDAVVVLGARSTEKRIESVTALPRFALVQSFRLLEETGFLRVTDGSVLPSHDLLAAAARRRMPVSVARVLHRASASTLEADQALSEDPLDVAVHWEACGEPANALRVLRQSADTYLRLGRPHESIAILKRARELAQTHDSLRDLDLALFEACHAVRAEHEGTAVAERIGLLDGKGSSEHQVAALELAVGSGRSLVPARQQLEAIAGNRDVTDLVRARAARILVIIAEDVADRSSATTALNHIADLSDCLPEAVNARLIFETVFGSPDKAVELAVLALRLAENQAYSTTRMQMEINAVLALYRCGEVRRAIEYGESLYSFARDRHAWSMCTSCACAVAEAYWCLNELTDAELWLERTRDSINRSLGPDRAFQPLSLSIEIALARGEIAEASDMISKAEEAFPRLRGHRMALSCQAAKLRVKMHSTRLPTTMEVEALLEGYRRHRNFGGHDLVADTLVAALVKTDRISEAERIRTEYLTTYRRDRCPVPPIYKSLRAGNGTSLPAT